MAKRIRQRVTINGESRWISGATQQELFDAYLAQVIAEGALQPSMREETDKPPLLYSATT